MIRDGCENAYIYSEFTLKQTKTRREIRGIRRFSGEV